MSISIERLRIWLLAGAGLLVVVIAAFLGYAHYRAHRFLTELPAKLGMNIRRQANNVTYSQSVGSRTIYTIHAAREESADDGKLILHDVGIVLYGRKQDRADRIYGKEFEYDQKNEVVRAIGEVHIDLQAPAAKDANGKMDYAEGKDLQGAKSGGTGAGDAAAGDVAAGDVGGEHRSGDPRLIHVTTSGLVFLRKLGVAATENEIEFESGGMTGHAVGADYTSDTGVIVLHSAVKVTGLQHERPVVLTASHAVLDRPGQTMVLSQAKYLSVGDENRTAGAQRVVVHLRSDGSAERLEAEGEVTLTQGRGGTVKAPRGEMVLDTQNKPQSAVLSGGVTYAADDGARQAQGEAREARAAFDKKGHPEHVVMTGAVRLQERVRVTDAAGARWNERELSAAAAELGLASDSAGKTQLRDAKATGNAHLKVVNAVATGGAKAGTGAGTTSSTLTGDVLTAHFIHAGNTDHIEQVHGDGHTTLRRVSATGAVSTGSGDSLVAHFRPATVGAGSAAAKGQQGRKDGLGGGGADEVSDAMEQGHVVMTELPARKPGSANAPAEERATADRAVYEQGEHRETGAGNEHGSNELGQTTLTGNVQVSDGTSVLWADRVVTDQQSGDATADGSVKASYGQDGSAEEPVHVLAGSAQLKHDSQIAIFTGVPGRPARMWQGASQVDAPVLQFDRKQQRLLAHGEGQGGAMAVHTVLVSAGSAGSSGKAAAAKPKATGKLLGGGKDGVVRVASRELTYSNETRKAEFSGGVEVESRDGTMRGQQVVVYLQPAQTGKTAPKDGGRAEVAKTGLAAGGPGFMAGSVERIVATGHIEMEQPGRRATGEQLVYTASDGMFVLTGTRAVPPKVVDDQRGTVMGTSMRFHSGDDNIVVSNGGERDAGARVRTETQVKNKQ